MVGVVIAASVLTLLALAGIGLAVLAWYAQWFGEAVAANMPPVAPAREPEPEPIPAIALRDCAGIELADTASVPDFRNDFTVEFWCRLHGRGPQYLVGNEAWPAMAPDDLPVPTLCGWVLRAMDANAGGHTWDVTVATMQDGRPQWRSFVTPPLPDPPGWRHVALVRSDGRLALYLDGGRVLQHDVHDTVFIAGPGPLYVGVRDFAHTDRQVSADMVAFRIGARALYRGPFIPPREFRMLWTTWCCSTSCPARMRPGSRIARADRRHGSLHNGAHWTVMRDRPGLAD